MSTDLEIYKKNRIIEATNKYNSDYNIITNKFNSDIKLIQKSNYSNKIKQNLINTVTKTYNSNVKILKNNYNLNISQINKFIPSKINITNSNKKALLFGINYTGTSNELYGCINDMNSIKERITNNGFKSNDITILTDLTTKKPTRENILSEFKTLLINSKPGHLLVVAFSGHGSNTSDKNGDETDGRDEVIIPLDSKAIVDDELKQIIQTYLKKDVTLFALFDSCFSGTMLDLKYQYLDSLNYDNYTENNKTLETLGNVFMISGCTDRQTSADAYFDKKAQGAMTWSLLESLKINSSCSWRQLVKNMRDNLKKSGFSQIPQFSCGKFEDIDKPIFI